MVLDIIKFYSRPYIYVVSDENHMSDRIMTFERNLFVLIIEFLTWSSSPISYFLLIASFLEHANRPLLLTHTRLFIYDFESKRIILNKHALFSYTIAFFLLCHSIFYYWCVLSFGHRHAKTNTTFDLFCYMYLDDSCTIGLLYSLFARSLAR